MAATSPETRRRLRPPCGEGPSAGRTMQCSAAGEQARIAVPMRMWAMDGTGCEWLQPHDRAIFDASSGWAVRWSCNLARTSAAAVPSPLSIRPPDGCWVLGAGVVCGRRRASNPGTACRCAAADDERTDGWLQKAPAGRQAGSVSTDRSRARRVRRAKQREAPKTATGTGCAPEWPALCAPLQFSLPALPPWAQSPRKRPTNALERSHGAPVLTSHR